MKLPNFIFDGHFNALRSEMGAALSQPFRKQEAITLIDLPIREVLRGKGIEVEFEDVKRLPDGTLAYKGNRVLLHIRDIPAYGDSTKLPKFHVAFCKTLESMQAANRFQRYVAANGENGLFHVNLMGEAERSRRTSLDVCQFCLGMLAWRGFPQGGTSADRAKHVKAFSLQEFFTKYPRDLISIQPKHTADTAPLNDYTADWPDVSERIKRSRNYRCEQCNRLLSLRLGKYLHVHHRNGEKWDNAEANLTALCIGCHAEQPLHGHLKAHPDYRAFMSLPK